MNNRLRMAAGALMILVSAVAFASVAEAGSPNAPQVTNRVDEQKARELRYQAWKGERDASKSSSVLGREYERMRDSKRKCVYKGREVKCPQSSNSYKGIPDPFKDPSAAQAEKSEALLRADAEGEPVEIAYEKATNQIRMKNISSWVHTCRVVRRGEMTIDVRLNPDGARAFDIDGGYKVRCTEGRRYTGDAI